jgi:hypothetical protein
MRNPFTQSAFTPLGPLVFETDQEDATTSTLTEKDCIWCWPQTVANGVCDDHIEAMATQATQEHRSRRNRR